MINCIYYLFKGILERETMVCISIRNWDFNSRGFMNYITLNKNIKKVMRSDIDSENKLKEIQKIIDKHEDIYQTEVEPCLNPTYRG